MESKAPSRCMRGPGAGVPPSDGIGKNRPRRRCGARSDDGGGKLVCAHQNSCCRLTGSRGLAAQGGPARRTPMKPDAPLAPRVSTFAEAEEIRPFGTPARVMMRSEDTGGAFSALLVMHGPGAGQIGRAHV